MELEPRRSRLALLGPNGSGLNHYLLCGGLVWLMPEGGTVTFRWQENVTHPAMYSPRTAGYRAICPRDEHSFSRG